MYQAVPPGRSEMKGFQIIISGVTWMPQVTSKLRGFSREQARAAGCVVTAAGSGICLSARRVLKAPLTLRISHL